MRTTVTHDTRYDTALKKSRRKNEPLKEVSELLSAAHDAGDARATYALARWYLYGKFFKKDLRAALRLLRQAAKEGVPDAMCDLAMCYLEGRGVPANPAKAAEFFLKAALAGEKQSIYEVGRCYYHGIGVTRDRRIAWVWLDRARELGVTESSYGKSAKKT